MAIKISLRAATPEDRDTQLDCYTSSHVLFRQLPPALHETIANGQLIAQHTSYRQKFPQSEQKIILTPEGVAAGLVWTDAREHEIRILDLAVLPAHRGIGIGSEIISRLKEQAAAANLPLSIHVETDGGFIPFFEKRGFRITETYPATQLMEWHP